MRYSSLLAAVIVCPIVPFAASAAGNLNMICSADVVVCEQMTTLFSQSHPDIKLSMVRLSAGEAYARIRSERCPDVQGTSRIVAPSSRRGSRDAGGVCEQSSFGVGMVRVAT